MGIGGGGGKGGGGGTAGQDLLQQTIRDLSAETKPIRETLSTQFLEALNTGGVGAQIPLITRMQESSKLATSNALRGAGEDFAAAGLSRSPFAPASLAGIRQQGEMETSMIPSRVAQGFIGAAPSYAMAPVGAMIGGASSLAGTQANRDIAKGQQTTDLFVGMMRAAGSAAAGGAACWIARRIYGTGTLEAVKAQWFIFYQWQGPVADVVRWLYLRYGERVSRQRWAPWLRPLFDVAVRRAEIR